ncbi:MAG: TetR family transcriptional regulator C-terminal domain-containing protein [Lapillicoccus sp.]
MVDAASTGLTPVITSVNPLDAASTPRGRGAEAGARTPPADKFELIGYCVRYYKARCVHRYDADVTDSTSAAGLLDAFTAKLQETLRDEAPMHRLWYDLRAQSMFEESLREAVTMIDRTLEEMIWRVVSRYAELAGREPVATPAAAYGMLDGVFQQALLALGRGDESILQTLSDQVHALLPLILRADPPATN